MSIGVKQYQKKPLIVKAIQWDGKNVKKVHEFLGKNFLMSDNLIIATLEGNMEARVGDYIIEGINGEHYPCKEDIFNKSYKELGKE